MQPRAEQVNPGRRTLAGHPGNRENQTAGVAENGQVTAGAQILADLNNQTSESGLGLDAEDQRSRAATREFLPLPLLRPKGGSCPRTDLRLLQTALSSCHLLPYIPIFAQPYHSCLHPSSDGIKGGDSHILGLKV